MKRTIRIGAKCYDADIPRVLTILNVTPDSFFEGSRFQEQALIDAAGKALEDGAFLLDIGGFSTRPGGEMVSVQEELARVIPAAEALVSAFPQALLSVDTFRSEVAKEAVERGVAVVNDVSGGRFDARMFDVVAALEVPYVLMHLRGDFSTMHQPQQYKHLPSEVILEIQSTLYDARNAGIQDILIDPGFGFSKSGPQNFELLRNLHQLQVLDCPILIGVSRKRMIWETLRTDPSGALNGTTAIHMLALQGGARWLRVHDTRPAIEAVKLFEAYRGSLANN